MGQKKQRSQTPSAEADLAVEQFPHLNERFYSADPSRYFRSRLNLLMLAVGRRDELDQLLAQGVTVGGLMAKIEPGEGAPEREQQELAFVTTEAAVLLHHASEALLRLFFAHGKGVLCPWLETARLLSFVVFKGRVAELLRGPVQRDQIGHIFLGGVPDEPTEAWQKGAKAVGELLHIVARRLLDEGNLYNATKHGLAVIAGPASLSVTNDASGQGFGVSGQSITYLEKMPPREGHPPKWHETTRWVSAEQDMWLTQLVLSQMQSLWVVAKRRYLGVAFEGVQVITQEALEVYRKLATGGAVTRMSHTLDYYVPSASGNNA